VDTSHTPLQVVFQIQHDIMGAETEVCSGGPALYSLESLMMSCISIPPSHYSHAIHILHVQHDYPLPGHHTQHGNDMPAFYIDAYNRIMNIVVKSEALQAPQGTTSMVILWHLLSDAQIDQNSVL
jgi:hypothetical protein